MGKQANSFTFSTIVFIILGLIVPIWPISLPFFWYLAYRSYKRGDATALNQSQGGMCICRVLGIGAGVSRECFGP